MLKKVCFLLSIICLFLLGVIFVMNLGVLNRPVIEDWLYLKSPDGKYAIKVISSRDGLVPDPGEINYKLDIYCLDSEGQKRETTAYYSTYYSTYYFSTEIGPIEHGLKDENYEIEWFDGKALLKFKDKSRTLTFIIDLEEFASSL